MALASASPFFRDDFGFRFALGADGVGVTFGFGGEAHLFGGSQSFDASALYFGLSKRWQRVPFRGA
jgi:hypothetical protein